MLYQCTSFACPVSLCSIHDWSPSDDFVHLFHEHYDKKKALYTGLSDDDGYFHSPFGSFFVKEQCLTVYVMSEHPKKVVLFKTSIYLVG